MRVRLGIVLLLTMEAAGQSIITTVAGTGTTYNFFTQFPLPASATSVRLAEPFSSPVFNQINHSGGMTSDTAGNIYFTEEHGIVLRMSPAGILTAVCGSGDYGYSGASGPASSFQLFGPLGVAVDTAGNVFVADGGNNRIVKITAGQASTFAGIGSPGFGGDEGPAINALISNPQGVAVDRSGNVFITEGGRLRKVTPDGIIHSVAIPYAALGLAVAGDGTVYVAANLYLYKLSPTGAVTLVAGNGQPPGSNVDGGPALNTAFFKLSVVAVAPDNTLYVIDSAFQLFAKITPDGLVHYPKLSSMLTVISGMTVTPDGSLYAFGTIPSQPGQYIQKIDAQGNATTVAGGGTLPTNDGKPATLAFVRPSSLATASDGSLYIATSDAVRRVTRDGIIHSVGAGLPARAVASDAAGNLYLAGAASITEVTAAGTALPPLANGVSPVAIGLDGAGNLYFADASSGRVRKVMLLSGTTVDVGAYDANNVNSGMFVDPNGNVFVSDLTNHVVRKIAPGGSSTIVAGLPGSHGTSSGDGGPATSAQLAGPQAVAQGPDGSLYIADGVLVRKVDSSGIISTIAGGGSVLGDGGPASLASFSSITDIKVDAAGNVYIADQQGARVREILVSIGAFILSANSANFSATSGSSNVAAQQITISGAAGLSWQASVTSVSGGTWLRISPASGTTPGTVTLTADASYLCPGTYQATVSIAGAKVAAQITVASSVAAPSPAKISTGGIVDAAAYRGGGVSPGGLVSIFGTNLAPSVAQASTLPLPITLSGVYVGFDGVSAPLLYVSPTQINAQVPWEMAGRSSIAVTPYVGGSPACPATSVPVTSYTPAIFTQDGSGKGQGAILNASDSTLAAPAALGGRPAHPGDTVMIFATGLGPVMFGPPTGWPGGSYAPVTDFTNGNPVVTVGGGFGTRVSFAGLAPGYVGLYQINVTLPPNAPTGPAIPLLLTIEGVSSNTVTLAIQ